MQLIRGSLVAHGKVMWNSVGRCGLQFESHVIIKDWLTSPSKAEQQRVDEIVSLVKAGAIPVEFGGAGPNSSGTPRENEKSAGDLELVVALLLDLEDHLAASNETLERHSAKLQNIEIAVQVLRALASEFAGVSHVGASLEDLRVVCAHALARKVV